MSQGGLSQAQVEMDADRLLTLLRDDHAVAMPMNWRELLRIARDELSLSSIETATVVGLLEDRNRVKMGRFGLSLVW